MQFIFIKLFIDEFKMDPKKIKNITIDNLVSKLNGIENIDFSKGGLFGGVASAGSLNKLKEHIIEHIQYFGAKEYASFYEDFKKDCSDKFTDWLNKNTR
jgi:hypothetical protein